MSDWSQQMAEWHELYVLIGTAAATLMGLTFVVITLSPKTASESAEAVKAFTTPIMAFFATIVVLSVIMLAPRLHPYVNAAVFVIVGILGLCYVVGTDVYRQLRESELGFDDYVWYFGLPILAYFAMLAVAIEMYLHTPVAFYNAAAVVLLLLIVGIRNAWDVVLEVARRTAKPPQ